MKTEATKAVHNSCKRISWYSRTYTLIEKGPPVSSLLTVLLRYASSHPINVSKGQQVTESQSTRSLPLIRLLKRREINRSKGALIGERRGRPGFLDKTKHPRYAEEITPLTDSFSCCQRPDALSQQVAVLLLWMKSRKI